MTKVIIIGCGVAGPTLAIFLKRLGFEPVIYERAKEFADAGLSLLFGACHAHISLFH
jgi:salicylate hydroxylase